MDTNEGRFQPPSWRTVKCYLVWLLSTYCSHNNPRSWITTALISLLLFSFDPLPFHSLPFSLCVCVCVCVCLFLSLSLSLSLSLPDIIASARFPAEGTLDSEKTLMVFPFICSGWLDRSNVRFAHWTSHCSRVVRCRYYFGIVGNVSDEG